jgi:hypothetical protein
MPEFKRQSPIQLLSIDAIELNVKDNVYGLDEETEKYLHIIEGEFLYCNLAIECKLVVSEKQLNEILDIENISIHKINDSILWIKTLSEESIDKFNGLNKQAKFLSAENLDDEQEDDIFILRLL